MVYIDLTKVGRTGLGDAQAGRTVQEIDDWRYARQRGIFLPDKPNFRRRPYRAMTPSRGHARLFCTGAQCARAESDGWQENLTMYGRKRPAVWA